MGLERKPPPALQLDPNAHRGCPLLAKPTSFQNATTSANGLRQATSDRPSPKDPSPPRSPRQLWATRRRFDPSSSPSASDLRLAVRLASSIAKNSAVLCGFWSWRIWARNRQGPLWHPENGFFSKASYQQRAVLFSISKPNHSLAFDPTGAISKSFSSSRCGPRTMWPCALNKRLPRAGS